MEKTAETSSSASSPASAPTAAPPTGGGSIGMVRSFSTGHPHRIQIQARLRFRDEGERASVVVSSVPRARAVQILSSVLRIPLMQGVEPSHLRLDLHREDRGRWSHDYGLAAGMAMVSSITRHAVPSEYLFLGDIDLEGRVRDVATTTVDALNDAIEGFAIELPITVVLAPSSARWVKSSPMVQAMGAGNLATAIARVWPGGGLQVV